VATSQWVLAKGSDIVGLEVRNFQDEKLGKIQDVIVDVGAGRIVGLLVNTGNVLGVGGGHAIVPLASFRYDAERKLLHLDSTQDQLKSSPRVEVSQWGAFDQPGAIAEVYRYYRVAPYSADLGGTPARGRIESPPEAANRPTDPAVNRGSDELTPSDQGYNELDLKTTTQIRKEVMAQPNLSVSGKNVKIITVNGRVMLRGSVPTESERGLIAKIAEAVAPGQVDNQLLVQGAETKERKY
jgi:hypothetical protein